ncbi:unnamed protein product [Gongylonema pulchrum]|uniref:Ig-like domain-containing protein n=1 Tax=Gongylonema pulchrum TaxID=637853 RepID=A0A183DB88_9BILA|nr:unnamed protein product [Gongylonema pulchrum]
MAEGRIGGLNGSIPRLDYSRNEQQPHVAVGRPITLWCMVSGHPQPTIRWMKDGRAAAVTKKSGVRLIDGGQGVFVSLNSSAYGLGKNKKIRF